jgi:hypothetical protein
LKHLLVNQLKNRKTKYVVFGGGDDGGAYFVGGGFASGGILRGQFEVRLQ